MFLLDEIPLRWLVRGICLYFRKEDSRLYPAMLWVCSEKVQTDLPRHERDEVLSRT